MSRLVLEPRRSWREYRREGVVGASCRRVLSALTLEAGKRGPFDVGRPHSSSSRRHINTTRVKYVGIIWCDILFLDARLRMGGDTLKIYIVIYPRSMIFRTDLDCATDD